MPTPTSILDLLHTNVLSPPDDTWTTQVTDNPETTEFVVPVPSPDPNQELAYRLKTSALRLVMLKEVQPLERGLFDRVVVLEFYEGSRNVILQQREARDGQAAAVQQLLDQLYAVPGYETADNDAPAKLTKKERAAVDAITDQFWSGRWWLNTPRRPLLQLMANSNTGFSLNLLGLPG